MKASIRLNTLKTTRTGHPVTVFLVDGKKRYNHSIFNVELQYWDQVNNTVLKSHPDYRLLISQLLNFESKVKQVNFGSFTFDQAKEFLFGEDLVKHSFYNVAIKHADLSTNGKLYTTVLNSFKAFAGDVYVEDITPQKVKNYLSHLLKNISANGAHTYLRTLNALYNKCGYSDNPFKGVRPKKVKTAAKDLTDDDLKKIIYTCTLKNKFDGKNTIETVNYYRYYWLLLFYLGGIDIIDLAHLRYDENVINGRVQFYRRKGGTSVFVNNKITDQAKEILNKFDCYPYLVPIYKYKNHNDFVSNMNERMPDQFADLQLTKKPLTKSARYSFINRAQQLLIDERITMEIVGHAQQSTHSIYTNEFATAVRDAAHERIIDL